LPAGSRSLARRRRRHHALNAAAQTDRPLRSALGDSLRSRECAGPGGAYAGVQSLYAGKIATGNGSVESGWASQDQTLKVGRSRKAGLRLDSWPVRTPRFVRFGRDAPHTFLEAPQLLEPSLQFSAAAPPLLAAVRSRHEGYAWWRAAGWLGTNRRHALGPGQERCNCRPPPLIGALIQLHSPQTPEWQSFSRLPPNFGLMPRKLPQRIREQALPATGPTRSLPEGSGPFANSHRVGTGPIASEARCHWASNGHGTPSRLGGPADQLKASRR